jgi:23S rRNA (uridine2552-2'-O)-methyltransferase
MKRTSDHYTQKAKRLGYPARSVFKLQEIQERFRMVKRGARVLDIGAAPGSWSRYCLLERQARVVGVDLMPVESLSVTAGRAEKSTFIQGDIFEAETVNRCLSLGPYDVVLSDAAPATSGNRTVDSQASLAIVRQVLEIARRGLKPGGNLIVKVFQGADSGDLLGQLRQNFQRARFFKPLASRKASKEVFFLAFYHK